MKLIRNQNVSILGAMWRISVKDDIADSYLRKCDGYCDWTTKQIVIAAKSPECTIDYFDRYQRKVLRHEVIHAFLFESGLHEDFTHNVGHDETFVDWFAAQFPKIKAVFEYLGCEE